MNTSWFSLLESVTLPLPQLCTSQFQNRPCPPGKPPKHLIFLVKFPGKLVWCCSDGSMIHRLALEKALNSPPTGSYSKIFLFVKPFIQMWISYLAQPKYLNQVSESYLTKVCSFQKTLYSRNLPFKGFFKSSQMLQQNSEYMNNDPWTRCTCCMRKELWNPFRPFPPREGGEGGFGFDW